MITKIEESGQASYGLTSFICDDENDIIELEENAESVPAGSMALIIDSGTVMIRRHNKSSTGKYWQEFTADIKGGGSSGSGSDPIVENAKQTGGFGYTEQGWTTLVSEAVTTTMTAQTPFASGEFATIGLDIKDGTTYKVIFNGTEYELTAVEDNGQTYIGELDETRMPNFNTYPFCILQDIGDSPILMATVSSGTHDVTVQWVADTIHKIDEKYLPASGGAMVVEFVVDGINNTVISSTKTVNEVMTAMMTVPVIGNMSVEISGTVIATVGLGVAWAGMLGAPYFCFYHDEETNKWVHQIAAVDGEWEYAVTI